MSLTDSYLGKIFTVADPDTRIRIPGDLMQFQKNTTTDTLPAGAAVGDFKRIPQGTKVKIDDVAIVRTGTSASISFAHALSPNGATEFGWTSTRNFEGKFVNETLGAVPPEPGAGKFSPNAAWEGGAYIGQRTLVEIVDVTLEIERISLDTAEAYLGLVKAAAAAPNGGVEVALNSAFRSYPEQKLLFEGWTKRLPGFNKAAPPGTSKHQNGIAFDIRVAGGEGNPTYEWLKKNGPARGFVRTVSGEPWHWEFDPAKAAKAVLAGTFKTSNVTV
jgi:hypothetical protein